ncbi:M20/M25/M40 family metallo-hydrolase [Sphingomonas sp.]|uniref:M20/M25/M40 family metallo-hydrolase n=1 Tax=Sphingomonas sp. TaxID=28214 RepID=UPI0031D578E9
MRMMVAAVAMMTATGAAHAQKAAPQADAQALELLKRGIAFRTVAGPGNQTPDYANYLRDALIAGGFAAEDVTVERIDDTAMLIARYRGTAGAGTKPIAIIGHMDVVAADPKDWERDPFTPVVENGYIYGRGATDNKFSVSAMIAALIQLKKDGFKPRRDIVFLGSGDEETGMKTTAALAEKFAGAELLLNIDGGGGRYSPDGKPEYYGLQAAEKSYADFILTVTDPGGHSSAPRPVNAIVTLARALERIGTYKFPAEVNEITKASLAVAAETAKPEDAAAIRAFLANPQDEAALKVLRANYGLVGQIGTTCVPTMVNAGHAQNALPQRATANVNCRIFPGHSIESIGTKLGEIAAEPSLTVKHDDRSTSRPPPPRRCGPT